MSPRTRTPWTRVLPVLLVLLGLWTDPVRTLDLDELFPFGAEAGDERLPPGSDSFRGLDLSGSVLLYHGGSYSKVYINTNGFVSFSEPPAEEVYLGKGPAGFPLIAALLGDLEGALEWALEGEGQGQVHFRWDSSPEVLERAAGLVQRAFPRDEGVEPNGALIVTWENMAAGGPSGRGDGPDNKRNTFQLVLVSLQSSSCAVLLYPRAGLQFLSTAIGGQNKPLEAGFNEGLVTSWIWGQTQGEYTRITTDDEASVQELTEKTNSGQAGVWVYEIGAEPFFVGIVPGLVPEVENATAPAVTMLPRQPDQPQVPSEESPTEATPEYETTYPDLEEDFPTETPTEYTTTFPEETEEPFYDYDEDETVTYPEPDRVPTTQPDTPEPSYPEPTQTASPVSEPLQPRNTVPENVEPGYSESSYPEPDEVQPRFTDPKPVQPQPPYSGPQQPHIVVVDEDEDINVNVFAYNSETCAYNGHKCSAFADCRDYSSGYCCHCRPGYYGNGKDCIAEGKPQRLNGKVNGRVFVGDSTSPVELVNNDLHTYVVANDGRVYVAISKIPDEVGPALQPLSSLGGVIGWAFALEQPGYQNGFSLIGGVFFRQAEVIFRPGNERLSIKQQFKGIDEHDHLVVSTELEGRLPEVPPGAFVHINPYKEIYQYSRNLITSSSNRDYNVTLSDGSVQTRSYQWQQTISFQSCPHDEAAPVEAPPTQQLSVDQIFAMYDADNHLSRYAMSNKIGSVHSGLPEQNPCFTGRHGCDNNAACRPAEGLQFSCECAEGFTGDGRTCHDIDECREYPPVCGFNALCSNQPGTFRCECSTGFTLASDGRTCIEENRPVDHCQRGSHDCDSANRALCSYTGGSAFVCSCLPGFTGDGRICQDVDECEQSRCHGYAVCFNTQGSYTCQCRPGFHGDGFNCSPTEREKTPCELSRESAQASTTSSILSFFRPRPAVAQYVPQCDQHGAYEPTQCHTSISQCWCVDANGQEIPNTRTGPGSTPLCIDQAVTPVPVGPTPRPDVHPVAAGTHLLFAQSGRIEHVPLDEHGIKKDQAKALLHIPDRVVIAVAFDCVEKTVYWTDITGPAISKASLDGGDIIPVITTELQSPEGLAVDHVSRLLFWTDSMKDTVEVSRLDGSQRRVLFDTDLVNPRPIVTNPPYGRLYWADWNRDGPKIETSNMDGSERSVLVKDDLELPNALSLDVSEQLLCWADAGTHRVECVDPHRRLRRTIVQEVHYPFGLVSFRGNLFYTDWRREAVVVVDRHSQKETDEFLPQRRSRPYGITMATTQCQQAYNYCSDNGGCSHLCLPRLGGFSCRCPDADDGRCLDRSL